MSLSLFLFVRMGDWSLFLFVRMGGCKSLLGNNHVALKVDAHLYGFSGLGRCTAPDAISVFGETGNVGKPTSLDP
jgi:hypothetical protein